MRASFPNARGLLVVSEVLPSGESCPPPPPRCRTLPLCHPASLLPCRYPLTLRLPAHPAATLALSGPAEGAVQPGDIVLRVNGQLCASFVALEEVLDDSVGGEHHLATASSTRRRHDSRT